MIGIHLKIVNLQKNQLPNLSQTSPRKMKWFQKENRQNLIHKTELWKIEISWT